MGFISANPYSDCNVYGTCKTTTSTTIVNQFNSSNATSNNSQYLQGKTPQQVADLYIETDPQSIHTDAINTTQFQYTGGKLHLLTSWLTSFINTFGFWNNTNTISKNVAFNQVQTGKINAPLPPAVATGSVFSTDAPPDMIVIGQNLVPSIIPDGSGITGFTLTFTSGAKNGVTFGIIATIDDGSNDVIRLDASRTGVVDGDTFEIKSSGGISLNISVNNVTALTLDSNGNIATTKNISAKEINATKVNCTSLNAGSGNITTTGTTGGGPIIGTSYKLGSNTISSFANLQSLAGLSYSSASLVKMTGTNTFTLDTSPYAVIGSDVTFGTIIMTKLISNQASDADFDTDEVLSTSLSTGYGKLQVADTSNNRIAEFLLTGQSAPVLAMNSSNHFSVTKDTASKYNVYFENGQYRIQNKVGNDINFKVGFFGVQAS